MFRSIYPRFLLFFLLCFLTSYSYAAQFYISPISKQTVNIPFTITIFSDDKSFHGTLKLSDRTDTLSPHSVEIKEGYATVKIVLTTVGHNQKIFGLWADDKGPHYLKSNSFDVTDQSGTIPHNASFTGIVMSDDRPLVNAQLQLFSVHPYALIASTQSTADGHFTFTNVLPGTFLLKTDSMSHKSDIRKITLLSHLTMTSTINLAPHLRQLKSEKRIPVLLVPGIMGSTVPKFARIVPRLPFNSPEWDSNVLSLADPFNMIGWTTLEKALESAGYQKGVTLFEVPYDWTLSVPTVRDKYLLPWIRKAKEISGSDKVDIISHSMGGLVTRSYLQSKEYQNDVRKFAMVGTPNYGSDTAYYLWEGGDPILADQIGNNAGKGTDLFSYFYTYAISYLFKDRKLSDTPICEFGYINSIPEKCDTDKIYHVEHLYTPSPAYLMPTYDWALQSRDRSKTPVHEENMFLKSLNGSSCLRAEKCDDETGGPYNFRNYTEVLTEDATGVETRLFTGINQQTLNTIHVQPQASESLNNPYSDGRPVGFDKVLKGDGTVLVESVTLKNLPFISAETNHAFLIKAFVPELFHFITGETLEHTLKASHFPPQMVIEIEGPVQIDTVDLNNHKKLTELTKDYSVQNSVVSIPNPANGTYVLRLQSNQNESPYTISIKYIDPNRNVMISTGDIHRVYHAQSDRLTFHYNNSRLSLE